MTNLYIFKINMYADDCILFSSGNNWNRMRAVIQPDLDGIQLWCDRNRLKLSITKSKTLLIGSISRLNNVDYTGKLSLAGTELPFVKNYCYLGILLDKYMSLLPLFDYAGFMLYSINQSDKNDLQVLQNDALRTCYNVQCRDRFSVKNLHSQAKLLSLDQRRQIQLLTLMYIHKQNVNPFRVNARHTRGADRYRFHTERCNNSKYRNSPYYRRSNVWDLLLKSTIDSDTLFEFKMIVKKVEINTYVSQCTV